MADALEKMNDESLMEHVKKHDHQAFSLLVERRSGQFYAASYRILMNKEEAEDVVQDAFLKLWDRPQIWKVGCGAKFTTWFYKIVINLSLDRRRRNIKNVNIENFDKIEQENMSQESVLIQAQQRQLLDEALKELPEKQLTALNLCFYEELSNKEAADIMGVGVKALESLLMRSKASIKNNLHRAGVLTKGERR